MQSYELCCDMIDVVIDISCIYGWVTFADLKSTVIMTEPELYCPQNLFFLFSLSSFGIADGRKG